MKCDIGEDQKETNSQAAAVFVQHYYIGRRAPTWERIYIPSVLVYGDLIGDPLPVIDYVQPNIEGDGYGCLYLKNATKLSDRLIVTGDGIDYSIFEKPVKPERE